MTIKFERRLRDGTSVGVHRNGGLRKLCACGRSRWAKCQHSWYLNFKYKGVIYRFSLDRLLGRRIDSRTEAEREAERLRVLIREGKFPPTIVTDVAQAETSSPAPVVETFEAYARDWLRTTAALKLKASTVRFYRDHLENHVFPMLGTKSVTDVARDDCRRLIATTREKGLKVSTVRGIVRTLSTVLSQAVEDKKLPANPAFRPGRYLKSADEPKRRVDPLTRDEAMRAIAAAKEHFPERHPWLLCALRSGLRLGELLALQWGDLDWRGRFLHVRRNWVEGKLTSPKSHQDRHVDMSLQLRAVLRLWRRQQRAAWFKKGLPFPDWVFPSSASTPLDPSNVRKALKEILEKAELRHRNIHALRHTFASLLLQQGTSPAYVQKQMGHASIQITVDVYGHLVPGGNREEVDRLDDSSAPVANALQTSSQFALRRSA